MKRLLILILVAAIGWSAYWFIAASSARSGFESWFAARQAEGWVAEYADLDVSGYPNRIDATFDTLTLADPETGVAVDLPFFQLFALSYKPNHLIAVWPQAQTLSFPDQKIQIATEDMRASLVLGKAKTLPLERSNLVIEQLQVVSSTDWRSSASEVRLALQKKPETEATYQFASDVMNLAPPVAYRLSRGEDLPRTLKTVQAQVEITFERPLDMRAIEDARPQPTEIDLKRAEIAWGDLNLQAAGKVTVDGLGYPTGDITVRATNWRDILDVARSSGDIPTGILDATEGALETLAKLSGSSQTLDIPLSFKRQRTWLGPLPIGPAPVIRLR
ncbi:DUF2125 domain-containing protein [Shimia sp. SDUM112013]|uniref:DUF2125 domain-containing protein n=1 Tax=Shimia sp. SDUM112013 TaxID=3136160 RepID=UPI0032EC712D